jgi:ABC-type lipoprotein release transport system permease subunit
MSQRDGQLDKELRYHLSRLAEDFQAQGLTPTEALRRAQLALSSQPSGIASLFVRDGMTLTALGLAAGLGLAWLSQPWLENQLYAVSPVEPWVIAAVAAILALVALCAVLLPALRASRIDPTQVLHEQ